MHPMIETGDTIDVNSTSMGISAQQKTIIVGKKLSALPRYPIPNLDPNPNPNPKPNELRDKDCLYYVHYVDFDRRLDEWLPYSALLLDTLQKAPPESELALQPNSHKKRRCTTGSAALGASMALEQLEKEHEEMTKVKNITKIRIGKWEVDTWYFSPYPLEYADCACLHVCEFCLKYAKKKNTVIAHRQSCKVSY